MTGTRLQPIFLKRNVTYYVMHTTTYKTKTFFSENVAAAVAAADRKKKLISFEVFPKNVFCAKQVTFLEVLLLFLTLFERHQHRCSIYWQSDYSQFFRVFLASVNQQMEEATNNWKKTYHYDYKARFRLLELIPCFGNADSRNRNENSKWQYNELLKRERRFYNGFRSNWKLIAILRWQVLTKNVPTSKQSIFAKIQAKIVTTQ